MAINPDRTALVIIDPQNDFLSEDGVVWDLVGELVEKNEVVSKLKDLIAAAKAAGLDVVYVPHYYARIHRRTPMDGVRKAEGG